MNDQQENVRMLRRIRKASFKEIIRRITQLKDETRVTDPRFAYIAKLWEAIDDLNDAAIRTEHNFRELVAKLERERHYRQRTVTVLESTIERLKTELSVCQDANVSLVKRLGEGGRDADITPVKRLPLDIAKAKRLTDLMLRLGTVVGYSKNKLGSTSLLFSQNSKEEHAFSDATLAEISSLLASLAADVEAAKKAKDAF